MHHPCPSVAPFVSDWAAELEAAWAKLLRYQQVARARENILRAYYKVRA